MNYWLQITSGRGPAECGWVVFQLVQKIVQKAHSKKLDCALLEAVPDRYPNTYQSALLSLSGSGAEKMVEQWEGTILWHGKSPFREYHKRANWYVGVSRLALPETTDKAVGEIECVPIKASGPGGQHVNKSSTAIRATHVATGIQVVAREERSQDRNRKLALARIAAILKSRVEDEKIANQQARWGQHNRLERGNPRRIYEGSRFRLRQR